VLFLVEPDNVVDPEATGQLVEGGTVRMAKYAKWITHKGRRILFISAPGLPEAEVVAALEEMTQEVIRERGTIAPLVLVDISRIEMTTRIINKAKEAAAATKAQGIADGPSAVVGLSNLQKAVAQLFGRGVHFGDTVEECQEWLVKEDNRRR
jgi:hypothetical protein